MAHKRRWIHGWVIWGMLYLPLGHDTGSNAVSSVSDRIRLSPEYTCTGHDGVDLNSSEAWMVQISVFTIVEYYNSIIQMPLYGSQLWMNTMKKATPWVLWWLHINDHIYHLLITSYIHNYVTIICKPVYKWCVTHFLMFVPLMHYMIQIP